MGLFNRKSKKEDLRIQPPASSRVEIELSKSASLDAAEKAKEANKYLNDLLVANGFTLKIFLAAGGHLPKQNERDGE